MESCLTHDPYTVLGLARGCDETEVRRRYLELVRQNPPDRAPQRFAEIRRAYEKLRDPVVRVESKLFDLESSGAVGDVLAELRQRLRARRLRTSTLLSLAERC
jgi:DnaJ-class molecular chaperone